MSAAGDGRVPRGPPAAALAVFGTAAALCLATPSLRRPLWPAVALLVLLPAVLGSFASLLLAALPRLRRRPRLRGTLAALLVCLPAWVVATAPMARRPWAMVPVVALLLVAAWSRRRRAVGIGLGVVSLALVLWPRGTIPLDGERSLVILGFDAATLDQIEPLIAAGELPHFARLKQQGAVGVLQSETLSLSPRVWTTIATGVPPQRHGIQSFTHPRHMLTAGRLWDEVVANDGTAGVVGWLVNWPPDPTLEFSLPGWLTSDPWTEPPAANCGVLLRVAFDHSGAVPRRQLLQAVRSSLAVSEADNAWRFGRDAVILAWPRTLPLDKYWRFRLLLARLHQDLFLELLERDRPQLAALVTYPTDALGHLYWKYHQPDLFPGVTDEGIELRGEVVRDSYRTADRALGRVLERLDLEHTTLLVVSDHGMEALPEDARTLCVGAAPLLGLLESGAALRTTAFGRVLILTPIEEGPDGEEALRQARGTLESAHFVDDAEEPAFLVSQPASNEHAIHVRVPDGVSTASRRVRIGDTTLALGELCTPEQRSGDHTDRGIVMLLGPPARPGARIEGLQEDVVPTALTVLGLPVPGSLPGRVLVEGFDGDWLAAHPVRFREGTMASPIATATIEQDHQVQERLRELGYVR